MMPILQVTKQSLEETKCPVQAWSVVVLALDPKSPYSQAIPSHFTSHLTC